MYLLNSLRVEDLSSLFCRRIHSRVWKWLYTVSPGDQHFDYLLKVKLNSFCKSIKGPIILKGTPEKIGGKNCGLTISKVTL